MNISAIATALEALVFRLTPPLNYSITEALFHSDQSSSDWTLASIYLDAGYDGPRQRSSVTLIVFHQTNLTVSGFRMNYDYTRGYAH